MKNQLFFAFTLFTLIIGFAQKSPITFERTQHDFGNIPELVEDIEYQFLFRNDGKLPLSIKNVEVECDCTKPTYSTETILVGKKGFVKVGYQRYNRSGPFEKKVIVIAVYDTSEVKVELTIKGNVIPKEKFDEKKYVHKMGNISVKSENLMMGDIFMNQPAVKEFTIYNHSETSIELYADSLPKFLKVRMTPAKIPAKSFATLAIKYDPVLRKDFGYVIDTLKLKSKEDTQYPVKKFIVRSTIREYFPENVDKEIAPEIALSTTTQDVGHIAKGETKEAIFEIDNIGEKTLYIRKIKSFCNCITILENDVCVIEPNQTKQIKYKVNTVGYNEGKKMTRTIMIYSNDPINPEQKLIVKALIY